MFTFPGNRVPARCTNPACRRIFPSAFEIENSIDCTVSGSTDICAVCKWPAKVVDGVFTNIDDIMYVVSAPGATYEILLELEKILIESYDKKESPDQTAAKVEPVLPEAAQYIRHNRFTWKSSLAGMIFAVASALSVSATVSAIGNIGPGTNININFGTQIFNNSLNRTPDQLVQDAKDKLDKLPRDRDKIEHHENPAGQEGPGHRTEDQRERRDRDTTASTRPTPKLDTEQRRKQARQRRQSPKRHLPPSPRKPC